MQRIKLKLGSVELEVELFDTPTAKAIYNQAPFRSLARTWGEEVYFSAPVEVSKEPDARDVVEPGEIAYWVEGQCIAIGYGRTPISHGEEVRLAAKTNIWGQSLTDVKLLSKAKDGDPVSVEIFGDSIHSE